MPGHFTMHVKIRDIVCIVCANQYRKIFEILLNYKREKYRIIMELTYMSILKQLKVVTTDLNQDLLSRVIFLIQQQLPCKDP